MTHRHAAINAADLTTGATFAVLSQHHVVDLATADTLAIDTINDQCLSAVVLEQTEGGIRPDFHDGACVFLRILVGESLLPPDEKRLAFSRQVWLAQ